MVSYSNATCPEINPVNMFSIMDLWRDGARCLYTNDMQEFALSIVAG